MGCGVTNCFVGERFGSIICLTLERIQIIVAFCCESRCRPGGRLGKGASPEAVRERIIHLNDQGKTTGEVAAELVARGVVGGDEHARQHGEPLAGRLLRMTAVLAFVVIGCCSANGPRTAEDGHAIVMKPTYVVKGRSFQLGPPMAKHQTDDGRLLPVDHQ